MPPDRRLFFFIILLTFVLIGTVLTNTYGNYRDLKEIAREEYEVQQELAETNVYNSLQQLDNASQVLEVHLAGIMEKHSLNMLEKYEENPDVFAWDLESKKKKYDGSDIYILNRDLEIIRTTYEPDLGMDFSQFTYFSKLLHERRKSGEFSSDRLDISINTGRVRKYSYMPTPDAEYILELSVDIADNYPMLKNVDLISVTDHIVENYDLVEKIQIFCFNEDGSTIREFRETYPEGAPSSVPDDVREVARETLLTGEENYVELKLEDKNHNEFRRYLPYFNYREDGKLDWWTSYVIEVTYNDRKLQETLDEARGSFHYNIFFTVLLFGGFTISIFHYFRSNEIKQENLTSMANYDLLTGLPNRKKLMERLGEELKTAEKLGQGLAVLFIDLNRFKEINDELGHAAGDEALQKIAARLDGTFPPQTFLGRLAGDEFIVLLSNVDREERVLKSIEKIHKALEKPFTIRGKKRTVGASIGYALALPPVKETPDELLRRADMNMYKSKENGTR